MLAQAECALKNCFFQARATILSVYVYICILLEEYLNIFTLSDFFLLFKNIEIFGFLAHTQPA